MRVARGSAVIDLGGGIAQEERSWLSSVTLTLTRCPVASLLSQP